MGLSTDSSPFQSSPLDSATSPRLFWQTRNSENAFGRGSPSPTRRSSIERLQKASRVKNSNILALEAKQEYDPTRIPQVERPLSKIQGNAFGGTGISGYRDNTAFAHTRSESQTRIPIYNPKSPPPVTRTPPLTTRSPPLTGPRPASRDQGSPTKSSLRLKSFEGPDSDEASFDGHELPSGKALHRYAKSVTFDAGPPEVNEYEMATPDISSIASSSREGSYDSADDDDDEDHYFMGAGDFDRDDESFDATLEDTMKTPVVLPDDWRQDPADDVASRSPIADGFPSFAPGGIPQQDRSDSRNSNRPLPPLPPPTANGNNDGRRNSTSSLSATAERMIGSQRNLPTPPPASSFSKSDIQSIAGNGKMTLEERLKLMMLSDDGKSAAEQQRERRLRRGGTRDRADSQATEPDMHDDDMAAAEEDDTLGDLGEYQLPPQISRESILRRVDGNKDMGRESDYNFSSPPSSPERHLPLDPDVPIPSTEDPAMDEEESNTPMKQEYDDGDSIIDQYHSESEGEAVSEVGAEEEDDDNKETVEREDDSASIYSNPPDVPQKDEEKLDDEQVTTPRAGSPEKEASPASINERLDGSISSKHNPFTDDLQSLMLPKPEEFEAPTTADTDASPQRPSTPDHLTSKPEYDGSGWGEPDEYEDDESDTGSVIHRPLPEPEEEEARVSPAIPEDAATIKSASGSKLKTRPSATPADLQTMREQRRIVSGEVPNYPNIAERHQSRLPKIEDGLLAPGPLSDDYMMRHPSFKSRSLTLDLDLGLSLDQDFDRVIEAQKVAFQPFSSQPSSDPSSHTLSRQVSKVRLARKPVPPTIDANIATRKQRGYLMRQNTKVVTASDKDNEDMRPASRSAGNSPVKQHRPQSWTVEPWNGQVRKKSIRKRPVTGAVPPLPGRESNTTAMDPVAEEDAAADATAEDSGERGRLFVKVLGVKDLDLPIPKSE